MQIEITFTCRECETENTLHTDTSNFGILRRRDHGTESPEQTPQEVDQAMRLHLACGCGHVSGELGLGYRFLEHHRPSIERKE